MKRVSGTARLHAAGVPFPGPAGGRPRPGGAPRTGLLAASGPPGASAGEKGPSAKHGGDEPGSARNPEGRRAAGHPCGRDHVSRTGLVHKSSQTAAHTSPAPPW